VAPEPARGPARDSLFQLDATRGDSVAARGAIEGVVALLAPDVIYLRAGAPPVYGRESARALLIAASGLLPATSLPVAPAWQPLGGGVSNDLRSGYTFGVSARVPQPKAPIRLEHYIAFWRRAPGRPWRIAAYAELGSPPLPESSVAADQLTALPAPPALSPALARARAEIRAADSSFADLAYRMGTAFAFANTAAPEGAVFGNSLLLVGPDEIKEFYSAQSASSLSWHPVYADVAGSRDLGFTVGEYIATGRGPSGAAVQRFGKYLTVWKRQRNGTWQFVVDGGNSSPGRVGQR
jgi:ketosteroid isomerase-like protein